MYSIFSRQKDISKTTQKTIPAGKTEIISPAAAANPEVASEQMLKDLMKLKIDEWFEKIINDVMLMRFVA